MLHLFYFLKYKNTRLLLMFTYSLSFFSTNIKRTIIGQTILKSILGHYSGPFEILNRYAVTAGSNSPSHSKLTNGTDDPPPPPPHPSLPEFVKLSANCSFVLTHDICSILLFFIASLKFSVPKDIQCTSKVQAK